MAPLVLSLFDCVAFCINLLLSCFTIHITIDKYSNVVKNEKRDNYWGVSGDVYFKSANIKHSLVTGQNTNHMVIGICIFVLPYILQKMRPLYVLWLCVFVTLVLPYILQDMRALYVLWLCVIVTLVLPYILQNMRPPHMLWLWVFVTISLLPTKLDGQLSEDDDDYIDPFDMMGDTRPRGKDATQKKVTLSTIMSATRPKCQKIGDFSEQEANLPKIYMHMCLKHRVIIYRTSVSSLGSITYEKCL